MARSKTRTSCCVTSSSSGISEKLAFLRQWRIEGVNLDVPKTFRAMFQEFLTIALVGATALVLEYLFRPSWLNSGAGLLIPPAIFATLLILKPFEESILTFVCSPMNYGNAIYNPFRTQTFSKRMHRIFTHLVFLASISLISKTSAIPPVAEFREKEDEIYKNAKVPGQGWGIAIVRLFLLLWMNFATKFIGTCTMIAIYRLYLELAIQSLSFISGYPLEKVDEVPPIVKKTEVGYVLDANNNNEFQSQQSQHQVRRSRHENLDRSDF